MAIAVYRLNNLGEHHFDGTGFRTVFKTANIVTIKHYLAHSF